MYDDNGEYVGNSEQYLPAQSRWRLIKICALVSKHTASHDLGQYLVSFIHQRFYITLIGSGLFCSIVLFFTEMAGLL
jgi:hypothetical protein